MRKFVSLYEKKNVPEDILIRELQDAKVIDKVRLGDSYFFIKSFFKIAYISYEDMETIFLRVEGSESGDFSVEENYIVIGFGNGLQKKVRIAHPKDAKKIIDTVLENHSNIENTIKKSV